MIHIRGRSCIRFHRAKKGIKLLTHHLCSDFLLFHWLKQRVFSFFTNRLIIPIRCFMTKLYNSTEQSYVQSSGLLPVLYRTIWQGKRIAECREIKEAARLDRDILFLVKFVICFLSSGSSLRSLRFMGFSAESRLGWVLIWENNYCYLTHNIG